MEAASRMQWYLVRDGHQESGDTRFPVPEEGPTNVLANEHPESTQRQVQELVQEPPDPTVSVTAPTPTASRDRHGPGARV